MFGSSTARFPNFVRAPEPVLAYVRDMRGWSGTGHSPLGALSVIALLGLVAFQIATGLISSDDDGLCEGALARFVSLETSDIAHDLHETSFNILLDWSACMSPLSCSTGWCWARSWSGRWSPAMPSAEAVAEPMRPARLRAALLCLVIALALTRWVMAGAPPLGLLIAGTCGTTSR